VGGWLTWTLAIAGVASWCAATAGVTARVYGRWAGLGPLQWPPAWVTRLGVEAAVIAAGVWLWPAGGIVGAAVWAAARARRWPRAEGGEDHA
jgi:hypothetical protein